jgi:hypothetical protein
VDDFSFIVISSNHVSIIAVTQRGSFPLKSTNSNTSLHVPHNSLDQMLCKKGIQARFLQDAIATEIWKTWLLLPGAAQTTHYSSVSYSLPKVGSSKDPW